MSCSNRSSINLELINLDVIVDIQNKIDPADMISLMFLLYENPTTALKKLVMFKRMVNNGVSTSHNLLYEWAVEACKSKITWKWELLEALTTCQLYNAIKKLARPSHAVKELFHNDNEIINPLRKIFYRVCEYMDSASYKSFQHIISSECLNVPNHDVCELTFLELICQEFFTPMHCASEMIFCENVKKLLNILDKIPACRTLYTDLNVLLNSRARIIETLELKYESIDPLQTVKQSSSEGVRRQLFVDDFKNEYQDIEASLEHFNLEKLKSDDDSMSNARGLCYIINQDTFLKNKNTRKFLVESLPDRPESIEDKKILLKTMRDHQLEVISHDNLSREKMILNIKNVVQNSVKENHSIFLLCILSHGTRDHVYSADSERVSIYEIEDLLDSGDAIHMRNIPKVLILEACQIDEIILLSDSPRYYIKKTNMITFCSTSPGYEAYRIKGKGSLFIYRLCNIIQKHSDSEHLTDLFTKVIKEIGSICTAFEVDQIPTILRNTLTEKVYLKKFNSSLGKGK